MKDRFLLRGRVNRWLLATAVVLATASVVVGACGGGSSDKALLDKLGAAWTSNDVAAIKDVYAPDAVIMWPAGFDPAVTTGVDAIAKLVAYYPVDPMRIGEDTFVYVPSAKDLDLLTTAYKGARFVAYPVSVARDLYMSVLEIRDGKVVNQWVSYMYRYTP